MMHREVVERKKTHVIVLILLLITCVLYLVEGVQALEISNSKLTKGAEFILVIFMMVFVVVEYLSCRISYKYSIIADKLIINKIIQGNETNLESIKINNIVFFGKRKNMPKEYKTTKICKYTCELFGRDTVYCVYNHNDENKVISFEPSEELQRRLMKYKKVV